MKLLQNTKSEDVKFYQNYIYGRPYPLNCFSGS